MKFDPSEDFSFGQLTMRFWVNPEATDGQLSVARVTFPPRTARAIPAHAHDTFLEVILVLEGEVRCRVDDRLTVRQQGQFEYVPQGAFHAIDNPSGETAAVAIIASPGLLVPEYFRDLAPIVSQEKPDLDALAAAMAPYGVRLPDQAGT